LAIAGVQIREKDGLVGTYYGGRLSHEMNAAEDNHLSVGPAAL
jgi:hypothetical protein